MSRRYGYRPCWYALIFTGTMMVTHFTTRGIAALFGEPPTPAQEQQGLFYAGAFVAAVGWSATVIVLNALHERNKR